LIIKSAGHLDWGIEIKFITGLIITLCTYYLEIKSSRIISGDLAAYITADKSLPSSTEDKITWSYTSASHTPFNTWHLIRQTEYFTFNFFITLHITF